MSKLNIDLSQAHPVVRFLVSAAVLIAGGVLLVMLLPFLLGFIAFVVVLCLIVLAWTSYKLKRAGVQNPDGFYSYTYRSESRREDIYNAEDIESTSPPPPDRARKRRSRSV